MKTRSSKSSIRMRRIADLVRQELSMTIRITVRDPRLIDVSIIDVDVSPDLKQATVFFTLLDSARQEEVVQLLYNARGIFRDHLAKHTSLRVVPKLRFIYDDTPAQAQALSELLKDDKRD